MTQALIDTSQPPSPSATERVVRAAGRVAHAAHEAGVLKTVATDAVEDSLHAARRAVVRGVHKMEDLADEAAHRVRKAPLASIAVAGGVGLLLGLVFGYVARCTSNSRVRGNT